MYKENIFKEIKKSQRKDLRVSAITELKKKKKRTKILCSGQFRFRLHVLGKIRLLDYCTKPCLLLSKIDTCMIY